MSININTLFDTVFVKKQILEDLERTQIIDQIMLLRKLLNAKRDINKQEYFLAEDKILIYILDQLMEIYGISFFNKIQTNI